MSLFIYFSQECPVKIWGLTAAERTERVLKGAVIKRTEKELSGLLESDSILIMRTDYLFDDRLVNYLSTTDNIILYLSDGQQEKGVAAHVPGHLALQTLAVIDGKTGSDTLPGVRVETPASVSVSFQQKLRKFEPPFVLPITADKKQELEWRLFDWAYKGITDLVTKWAWPRPARWAVGHCVRLNIKPNHVTLIGLVLVILAGICFTYGQYGWGLLAGWLMTFLDTVDGKLARVTVTSSTFGHYFDHLTDLVHPPIWYMLWGVGLTASQLSGLGLSLGTLFYIILIAYVAGRLVEGSFKWFLGASFGIFCWQPIDSYFRLITARRNPNMILLTISVLMGRPDLGLLAVVLWTVATSVFLIGRFVFAGYVRFRQGTLNSWLSDADKPMYEKTLAVRLFTRHITR